ncbi:MAG: GNAT family N-acetyltransferase [Cyanobacteria bacterium SZAS LIN-2]|nr:GNAT family N-acetyltransferase [Cyanobacteria bacterium SZAS LIN-3]MBS1998842.1 GNAT family N-acetyltransferase [Cyanobacteria bacterium SZAS LIN-2]MBS2010775.1 GNAT family N-acetyltransferase [Cyanobacteria bacterium SZAS TMP-1]
MSKFEVIPVTLSGKRVRLEPLTMDHLDGLVNAAKLDPQTVFKYHITSIHSKDSCRQWIEQALAEQASGTSLPFATFDTATGNIVGATRFMAIEQEHLRAEIGYTWLGIIYQRTGINREAKYLMLQHAFETWKLRRVEFKTHHLNTQSRTALLRLGAKEEGILRKHMVTADGGVRNSVYFSIIDDEWLEVKRRLAKFIEQN